MYLDILKTNVRNNYITKEDYSILSNLYNLFDSKKINKVDIVNIKRIIKECYDLLHEQCNQDLQIYEVEDLRIYPKTINQDDILILENIECLMQTKNLTSGQYFILKQIKEK